MQSTQLFALRHKIKVPKLYAFGKFYMQIHVVLGVCRKIFAGKMFCILKSLFHVATHIAWCVGTLRQPLCPRSEALLTTLLTLLHTMSLPGRDTHKFCNKPLTRGKTNFDTTPPSPPPHQDASSNYLPNIHPSIYWHRLSCTSRVYPSCLGVKAGLHSRQVTRLSAIMLH